MRRSPPWPRRPQSLRGQFRKLVSEFRKEIRLYDLDEPPCALDRNSDSPIALVSIESSLKVPLAVEKTEQNLLIRYLKLLSIQIHRVSRFATIIHEPHCQSHWRELYRWHSLTSATVEKAEVWREDRKTARHKAIRNSISIARPRPWRC